MIPIDRPTPKDIAKEEIAVGNVIKSLRLNKQNQDDGSEIAIIKGLGAEEHLRNIWLRCRGYDYDWFSKKWVKKTKEIMDEEGIRNFMLVLDIILRMDFSNMDEKDIPRIVYDFYKTNFSQFAIYHEDFKLNLKNINVVHTGCFIAPYIAARNAKNAGHRNTVRGTLSENVFLRSMTSEQNKKSFLDRVNPFRKRRE